MEEFLKRCESVRVKCRVAKEEDMLLKRKLQNDSCESVSPSCCSNSKHEDSSDGVEMSPRSSDLENAGSEISTSTDRVLREHILLQLPSPNKESSMPSAAELERFFAAAEKYEQKRFAQKYNYDIVKDVPLEGRYHWVRLLP
ncbi:cyclin-dependent kinase inhibitor 7-like isoform X2 [Salvia hispanica]|uniref:cyclin-dependent kinase inhibitor 7-like isoform X2 n=1 Tax=Salvia hispanica TaxID=49212 RepID=UPI002009C50D|nr:cyclin-dependent kinase inhibitor 7-like isoform X2 [Salvia hispanica]